MESADDEPVVEAGRRQARTPHIIPPSEAEKHGYSWVVLLASFTVRLLVFGSLFSVGVLYVEWLDEFETTRGQTAWIGSIATGTTLFVGPVAGALLNRFSCRQVTVTCGVLCALGLIISSQATGILFLCITFGCLTGAAGGAANLAVVVSLSQYFDKRRPLAMGIGSAGVGVGAFAFGLAQDHLTQRYTWRGSMLLVGGIMLNVVACGMLLVAPHKVMSQGRRRSVPTNFASHQQNDECRRTNDDAECERRKTVREPKNLRWVSAVSRIRGGLQYINKQTRLDEKTKELLSDPVFWIVFISDFLSWLTQFVPYVHLPERAKLLGISEGALLVSLMGLSNALGKAGFGALCTVFSLPPFNVFVVAQFLLALSTILSPLCVELWSLICFSVSFGFLSGCYCLMMVVPVQLFGEDKFAIAYGIMLAGEGVGVYLGPPLVGWMSDHWHSYDVAFYLTGACLFASAAVMLLVPCYRRRAFQPKLQSNDKLNANQC